METPESVDAAIAKIKKAGGEILRMLSDAYWGGRTSYFPDPINYLCEVAWNPSSV